PSPNRRPPAGTPAEPSSVQWDQPTHPLAAANARQRQATPQAMPVATAAANAGASLPPADTANSKRQNVHAPHADPQPAAAVIPSYDDAKRAASVAPASRSNALNDIHAIVPEPSDFGDAAAPATVPDPLEQRLAKRARDNPRDLTAQLDLELYGLLR